MSEAPTQLRAVFFDAAGTLIELRESIGESYARFAEPYGAGLPAWRLDDAFVRVLKHAPPRVFPGLPRAEIEREEIAWWRAIVRSTFLAADSTVKFSDFDAFYAGLFDHYSSDAAWRVRDGAIESLSRLRDAGLATGALSNFDHRLPHLLQTLGLKAFLDTIVIPAECGFEKPAREIFQFACAQLDLPPEACAHVGDDAERDVEAARQAGLHAVALDGQTPLALLVSRFTETAAR